MASPTAITTNTGQITAAHPSHRVFVRQKWANAWTAAPYLHCQNARWSAAPDISRAQFEWRYGIGMQPDQRTFSVFEPKSLDRWYVKVEIDRPAADPLRWYGVFLGDDQRDLLGGLRASASSSSTANGWQRLNAFGLEALLDRVIVDKSYVADGSGEKVVPRALPFNGGAAAKLDDQTSRGNRFLAAGSASDRNLFCEKISAAVAQDWTSEQIVKYLLAKFPPRDAAGQATIEFVLTGQTENLNDRPRIEAQDKTVKRLLDELVDRKRILGWCVQVAHAVPRESVFVRIFSFADQNITLQDGLAITANDRTRTLDFDSAFDIQSATLTRATQHACDRVRVTGAQRVGVGTLSASGGSSGFTNAWTAGDVTEFWLGASEWSDYPDDLNDPLTLPLREVLNKEARERYHLRKVFTTYRLHDNFLASGKTGSDAWCPQLKPDWSIDPAVSEPFWGPGLRFRRDLPLKAGFDYSESPTDPVPERTATDTDDPTPEPLRPFAAVKDPNDETYPYYFALDTEYSDKVEHQRLTARVTVSDDAPEFQVIPSGSRWALAGVSNIHPLPDTEDPDPDGLEAGQFYDHRNMLVTVAIQFPARVEICWPRETPTITGDVLRELVIDLGDDARLDYLVPGTMLEVCSVNPDTGARENEFTRAAAGGFVRDDRPRMQTIAETAYKWYSVERQAFELTYRQVTGHFAVGDLIVSTGAGSSLQQVRTVITSVAWDLAKGLTSITTDYAELDVRGDL